MSLTRPWDNRRHHTGPARCCSISRGDAAELIRLVPLRRPELAAVDIRMPPKYSTEGLEAARVIQRDFPDTAVVVLSAHVEVEQAMDLLANGHGTGYLLKSRVTDIDEFVDTLRRVERGGSAVDPALVQELVAARRTSDPLDVLTSREREVLALMAEGRSNAGIASTLVVSASVVEKHVARVFDKLGLSSSEADNRRVLAVLRYLSSLPATRRVFQPAGSRGEELTCV
jgi:DNA-binding NarL/FixJ family response regulator